MKFNWKDEDIAVSYRQAKDKKEQIHILAELNAVSIKVMKAKLISLGFYLSHKTYSRADMWTDKEQDKMVDFINKGFTCIQIAKFLSRHPRVVMDKSFEYRKTLSKSTLSCTDIMQRYSVSRSAVCDWIRQGKLHAIRLSGGYGVMEKDLAKFETKLGKCHVHM